MLNRLVPFCFALSGFIVVPAFAHAEVSKPAYPWKDDIGFAVFSLPSLRPNLFYVALPFDDLAHPDLAEKWLPHGWMRRASGVKPLSACKDRWVEIKNPAGVVCYAKWEGFGPADSDDAEYVFGSRPPRARLGAEISPEVARYLEIDPKDCRISWRFVDDSDVRPGRRLGNEEQDVLLDAQENTNKAARNGSPAPALGK